MDDTFNRDVWFQKNCFVKVWWYDFSAFQSSVNFSSSESEGHLQVLPGTRHERWSVLPFPGRLSIAPILWLQNYSNAVLMGGGMSPAATILRSLLRKLKVAQAFAWKRTADDVTTQQDLKTNITDTHFPQTQTKCWFGAGASASGNQFAFPLDWEPLQCQAQQQQWWWTTLSVYNVTLVASNS